MIKNLLKVKTGGEWFLCNINKTADQITLKNAVMWEKTLEGTIDKWLKKNNVNGLADVIIGRNESYIEQELDEEGKLYLQAKRDQMQEIKRTAIGRLENKYYTELLNK